MFTFMLIFGPIVIAPMGYRPYTRKQTATWHVFKPRPIFCFRIYG